MRRGVAAAAVLLGMWPSAAGNAAQPAHGHPCAVQVKHGRIGPHVQIERAGAPVAKPGPLQRGDVIKVSSGGRLLMRMGRNTFVVQAGQATLECDTVLLSPHHSTRKLVVTLETGQLQANAIGGAAAAVTPDAVAIAHRRGTRFVLTRRGGRTGVKPYGNLIELADAKLQRLRVRVRPPEDGIMDPQGLRLDVYPFSVSPDQRPVRRSDGLVPYWADGRTCSRGCRPPGARTGWPIKPFHRQHALRAGLNEIRPANFHVGIDIQAAHAQQTYAMSSGRALVIQSSGPDERVQVGRFVYWHINHQVHDGQFVRAYRTPLGRTKQGYGHVHLSELIGGTYLNPLRPGGRVLGPWSDTEPPVIGKPRIVAGGRVIVDAFDPQSYTFKTSHYKTPVLAPAALAWRLFDSRGHRIGPLEWAYRGSQHYADSLRHTVYAPGATNPGFWCFIKQVICKPTWRYWLAGGLTPPLPSGVLSGGRYRLSIYAWDWSGRTSARDYLLGPGSGKRLPPAPAGVARARPDVE
ncbi:MAG: hypothetical protein QOF37_2609 [Thermoleophilaceae bacterium]|nr:hypothetical protein [Thermoleophilaceae bacterium]